MRFWGKKKEITKTLPQATITIIDDLDIPEPHVLQKQTMDDATDHIKLLNKLITDKLYDQSKNGEYTALNNVFKYTLNLNLFRNDQLKSCYGTTVAEYMNIIVKQWEKKGYSMIFDVKIPYSYNNDIYLSITITWNKIP